MGGVRIIDRVAASLRPHTDSLLIAGGDAHAGSWIPGARAAPDVLPLKASITGIHAALAAAKRDIIAVAWDMPFVPSGLIATLRSGLQSGISAVVPRPGGQAEPLCAAYSSNAADDIRDAAARGLVRMTDILDALGNVTWLDDDDLRQLGDPAVMFFNVNSPADLKSAEDIARSL